MQGSAGQAISTNSSLPTRDLEWKPLVLSQKNIEVMWKQNMELPHVFDDLTHDTQEEFMGWLASPKNVFYEIGDMLGVVSITNVRPRLDGLLRFVMYDRKLRGKENVMVEILRDVFRSFALRRLTSIVPRSRETEFNLLMRIGFRKEGRMREASMRDGGYEDLAIMGLLAEEAL